MSIAKELDLPLVATNDCHYLSREDSFAHEILLCIQTGKTMDDPKRMRFPNDEFYVKSSQEMTQLFPDQPEAIANTIQIADQYLQRNWNLHSIKGKLTESIQNYEKINN